MPNNKSKRYQKAAELVEPGKLYSLKDAAKIIKSMPATKFDSTLELAGHLGIDPKQSTQAIRGVVSLPHGSGKNVRVVVFTSDAEAAKAAGADYAGLGDLIAKIQEGWLDFDVAVATPEAMKEVRSVARVLGPRGMMPNPKTGTVTDDIAAAIKEVKAGRVEFKSDKTANVAVIVGRVSFSEEQIVENVKKVMDALVSARPDAIKGVYIQTMYLSSSMNPSVKLNVKELTNN